MSKKDWYIIVAIVIVSFITALLLNCFLSIDGFIPTIFCPSQWLSFWATLLTGIFALIVGYLAISFSNKNSEKVLHQQTNLLRKQDNYRIKEDILIMVKKQYLVFNILNHCSALYCINQDDKSKLIQQVLEDRAKVHDMCNSWSLFVPLYLQSPSLFDCVNKYQQCWKESVDILDNYLRLQIEYLQKAEAQDIVLQSKKLYNKLFFVLSQQELSSNSTQYEKRTDIKDWKEQESKLDTDNETKKEQKNLISQISIMQDQLIKAQDIMAQASIEFLSKINMIDFTSL